MTTLEMKIDALIKLHLCDSADERSEIMKSLRELVETNEVSSNSNNPYTEKVRKALSEIGIPDSFRGHNYLVCAVTKVIEEPKLGFGIVKNLYPMVGEACGATAPSVERCIRHAIECGWKRCDIDTALKYFDGTVNPVKGYPTNSEFIVRLANILR